MHSEGSLRRVGYRYYTRDAVYPLDACCWRRLRYYALGGDFVAAPGGGRGHAETKQFTGGAPVSRSRAAVAYSAAISVPQHTGSPAQTAAGALRQKKADGKADASDLVFLAYDAKFPSSEARHPDSMAPPNEMFDSTILEWLSKTAGVKPAPWVVHDSTTETDSIVSLCKETQTWSEGRESYSFEIDGLVFKVDDLEKRDLLGMTAHHPRWALRERDWRRADQGDALRGYGREGGSRRAR